MHGCAFSCGQVDDASHFVVFTIERQSALYGLCDMHDLASFLAGAVSLDERDRKRIGRGLMVLPFNFLYCVFVLYHDAIMQQDRSDRKDSSERLIYTTQ